jgi:opacity protein-like surface antigen
LNEGKKEEQFAEEIDFAYTRTTIKLPYQYSVLLRMGIVLPGGVLLYSKVGVRFENVEIWDHPETIDVGFQQYPKTVKDKIFDKKKNFFVASVGIEAPFFKKMFLRLEFSYAGNPQLRLDKNNCPAELSKISQRQTEFLELKSMRKFSFLFGTSVRF